MKLSQNSALGRKNEYLERKAMQKKKERKKKKAEFIYVAKSFKCPWSASLYGQHFQDTLKEKNVISFR